MRTSNLKKRERNSRKRVRPEGCPAELITLKNGLLVGCYGVRNTAKGWERLIDNGYPRHPELDKYRKWITSHEIEKIEAWTEKRQKALEETQKYQTQRVIKEQTKEEVSTQSTLAFASTQMIHTVSAGGQTFRLLSDFKGNLLNTKSKHKTAQEYLAELISVHGRENVSCQSMLQ